MPSRSLHKTTADPLPLCFYGDPVLEKKSQPIDTITDELRELAERMIVTMDVEEGIGLAAPQVGLNIRLITLDVPMPQPGEGEPPSFGSPGEALLLQRMPIALVNPVITSVSNESGPYDEGCLSIPDLRGRVVRPLYVDIEATTIDGERLAVRCGGLLARCIQHEIDHLEGVLFPNRMEPDDLPPIEPGLRKLKKQTTSRLRKRRRPRFF